MLTIHNRRERAMVAAADLALRPVGAIRRLLTRRESAAPQRILCLRLERIGDLLMTLPALAELRALAPDADIDLVVGSWNAALAGTLPMVTRVETLDARWLSRGAGGKPVHQLLIDAARWRQRRYDLAINFEPDIRSNLLLAASAARRLAGFVSGGGSGLLDVGIEHDPRIHTAENGVALVQAIFGSPAAAGSPSRPRIPDTAEAAASRLLPFDAGRPIVGVHVGAGRAVKQWPEERFRDVAARLIANRGAFIVFTGDEADRPQVAIAKAQLPPERVLDLAGRADLVTLAALVRRFDVLLTGDTGPMHLASSVGTPVVAVFGPSDPVRYTPRGALDRVVRIDLPCAPCNRIRLPPARCTGHTPDCLAGVDVSRVLATVEAVLAAAPTQRAAGSRG
jgi:ADP-heptose:LPS heptosyltransferase